MKGLVIAAPASGSGKTIITLAILRALRNKGHKVGSLKIGPDHIDPGFHTLASGVVCRNFDTWAMRTETLEQQVASLSADADMAIAEGVMGLFDGARDGSGSTADAAVWLDWPIVLVVDVRGQAASAAALVLGFDRFRDDVRIAGVIFNRVGSARHEHLLEQAMVPSGIPVLGYIRRDQNLSLDSRHLGLVQAQEVEGFDGQIEVAAEIISGQLDMSALVGLARAGKRSITRSRTKALPLLGENIAIARDDAFSFLYPHIVSGWEEEGCTVSYFSPLGDEFPDNMPDAIFLPGGYPELHGARLAGANKFLSGLRDAAKAGVVIYGECGGYMVLGKQLTDKEGRVHQMADLLSIETSFAEPNLHLGYRELKLVRQGPLGDAGSRFRAHEFHYSKPIGLNASMPLFEICNADDSETLSIGCQNGSVMGSYAHLIDRVI